MLNLPQGIHPATTPDSSPDKRKAPMPQNGLLTTSSPAVTAGRPMGNFSVPITPQGQTTPTTQFIASGTQAAPQAQTPQASTMPQQAGVLFGQMATQLGAMAASFFKGNSREARNRNVDEREEHQRALQDEATPGFLGESEDSKVAESGGASMGGGQ